MEILLDDITSGYNLSKINANFKVVQNAINNLLVHTDGTNELQHDLDFNGFSAINVGSLVIGDRDIIEEIESLYDAMDEFLQRAENLLREIEAIASGELQDRNQGNGQITLTLEEDITEDSIFTIPSLSYIVGRNCLRVSYQGAMCYPHTQFEEVGTFDMPSNEIKFLVEIKSGTVLNIWISGVGNIIEIKEELDEKFEEYTQYVTTTKAEIDQIKTEVSDYKDQTISAKDEATTQAGNAATSATNASLSETNAAASAEEAEEYSNTAKIWAEGTDEEVVPIGGEHSSKGWAQLSEESAEKAEEALRKIGTPITVLGRVDTVEDLPTEGNKNGDMYFVGLANDPDKAEYVWIDTSWEYLGQVVATNSATEETEGTVRYATQTEVNTFTGTGVVQANKLSEAIYTKEEVDAKVNEIGTGLPEQTGNADKILKTDGTDPYWDSPLFTINVDGDITMYGDKSESELNQDLEKFIAGVSS